MRETQIPLDLTRIDRDGTCSKCGHTGWRLRLKDVKRDTGRAARLTLECKTCGFVQERHPVKIAA